MTTSKLLRELADKIDAKTISDEELCRVKDVFSGRPSDEKIDPIMLKYLFLGWYIYEVLLPDKDTVESDNNRCESLDSLVNHE